MIVTPINFSSIVKLFLNNTRVTNGIYEAVFLRMIHPTARFYGRSAVMGYRQSLQVKQKYLWSTTRPAWGGTPPCDSGFDFI